MHYRHGIRTLTLDLDDTLWAIGPVIARAESALRDWLAEQHPEVRPHLTDGRVYALRGEVVARHADRAHDMTFVRREVIARLGAAVGCRVDVDAAFDVFDRARNTLELFADVRPALESLGRRYTLLAVTNGNANLEKIGIDDLFDGYISAHSAGAAKPERVIFEAAVAAGGAAPGETLHVGDHPEIDVDGARAAGLRAVWLNRNGSQWPAGLAPPDGIVGDLHELDLLLGGG